MKFVLQLVLFFYCSFSLQATTQPNVVFILIDDISHYGISAYGAKQLNSEQGFFESVPVSTPHIDRLASEGLLVENAFTYAVCEPTRVALMTGMNNNRNFIEAKALHESQITFSDVFKRAGYVTGITGKWKQSRGTAEIHGQHYVEQFNWDEVHCFDLLYEGARHIDPNFVINGKISWCNQGTDPETGRRYYGPDLANRFALDFIERHRDEPFFLYYPMLLVHDEHTPTPDTQPEELYDKFEVMTHTGVRAENQYGAFKGDDRRYFPDMMDYMDKLIGRVTDKLEALGLREKTLIVVMGDNGTKTCFSYTLEDGSKYIGGKGHTTMNGLQVPLILSMPGTIQEGSRYTGLVNLTDLYPTLCEFAGITLPNADAVDGLSFWPQASGQDSSIHREHIYTWYNANKAMAQTDKLIRFAHEPGFKLYAPDAGHPEGRFFDLRSDPYEKANDYNKRVHKGLGIYHHSGMDRSNLNDEQQSAYDRLGNIIKQHAYVPVSSAKISPIRSQLRVGESRQLSAEIFPENSTLRNVIWKSSDPEIASVDKFGQLLVKESGEVEILLYTWDEVRPLAAGKKSAIDAGSYADKVLIKVYR
ncbi:MAG: Arylsulfatase [Opitutia bacterium UBA7350]|nr:MAG: Arylsulfatase [Opitutae bacterium UBA7350]